jgi:hypothetical protein
MKYPDNERILIVRPCLKTICLGVRSASKLLSVVLYRARNCREDETTFVFTCTQADLVNDLCEELTTKQLHDMAIPVLQLLGYLEVNGSGFRHTYTVHLDRVQEALSCYRNKEELELLLISFIYKELEEVPMELEEVPIQLEEVLKHLEVLLKTIGKSSNSKRGRKPRPQAALEVNSQNTEYKRDITDRLDTKRESAFAPHTFLPDQIETVEEDDSPTVYRMPAIKLNGVTNGHHPTTDLQHSHDSGLGALHSDEPAHGPLERSNPIIHTRNPYHGLDPLPYGYRPDLPDIDPLNQAAWERALDDQQTTPKSQVQPSPPVVSGNDGAATVRVSESRASGKPKRGRKKPVEVQLTLQASTLKEWYDELRGLTTSLSKRNVTAWESLARKAGTDDKNMFLSIVAVLDDDPWFEKSGIGIDPYWIDRQWENKYIFLQRKKPAPLADKKPMDPYTANSMDKEKMRRRLEERKADRLAREAAAAQQRGVN